MQLFEHWGCWCPWIYFANRNKSFNRYHNSSNSGGELEIVTMIKKGSRVGRKYTSQIREEVGEQAEQHLKIFLVCLLIRRIPAVPMWLYELSWEGESWGKNLAMGICTEMKGYSENKLLCSSKKVTMNWDQNKASSHNRFFLIQRVVSQGYISWFSPSLGICGNPHAPCWRVLL